MGRGDEHVQGALVALRTAEVMALQIRRDLRGRTLRRGLVCALGYVGVSMLSPAFAVDPAFVLVLAVLLAGVALHVHLAPVEGTPAGEAVRTLVARLADAGRRLRAIEGHDPYRSTPMDWVGGDPTTAKRPWTRLATIRATAAAVRTRALPRSATDGPEPASR